MIRKLAKFGVVALTGLLSIAANSFAADLPNRKAPAEPYVPTFTWAGSYFGAHLGYMWGRTRVVDTGVLVETGAHTNGLIGGLVGGHNWQRGAWVYGLEFDGSLAGVHGHGIQAIAVNPNSYDLHWAANARARLGYSITPTMLLFVAGGVAITDLRFTDNSVAAPIASGVTRIGWTIGAGVDYAFTNNLIGRIEYLYADYGRKGYTISVLPPDWYNIGFKAQTVRAALLWKF